MPVSVSLPVVSVTPPLPEITPAKVPVADVTVSVLLPRSTWPPLPVRLTMEVPPLVSPEMLKVPSSATSALSAIEPVPLSASVAPKSIVVTPL